MYAALLVIYLNGQSNLLFNNFYPDGAVRPRPAGGGGGLGRKSKGQRQEEGQQPRLYLSQRLHLLTVPRL